MAREKMKKIKKFLKALRIPVDTFGTFVPNVSTDRKIRHTDRVALSTGQVAHFQTGTDTRSEGGGRGGTS
jgi:hypothetical protein